MAADHLDILLKAHLDLKGWGTFLVHGVWLTGRVVTFSEWLAAQGVEAEDTNIDDRMTGGVYLTDVISYSGGSFTNLKVLCVTRSSIDAIFPSKLNFSLDPPSHELLT